MKAILLLTYVVSIKIKDKGENIARQGWQLQFKTTMLFLYNLSEDFLSFFLYYRFYFPFKK